MPVPATLLEALGTWRRGNVSKRLNNHHQQKWTKDLLPIDTSEKMRQMESQFLNKELEKKHVNKHSWAKSNWGKGHQRNKLQKRWVAKIWVTKWTSCKGFVLQKSWLAKVLSCKSIELQEQPIVFRKKWNHLVFIGCYNFGSCSHTFDRLRWKSGNAFGWRFFCKQKLKSWIWLCFLLRATIFDHAQDFSADSGGGVAMDLSWHLLVRKL